MNKHIDKQILYEIVIILIIFSMVFFHLAGEYRGYINDSYNITLVEEEKIYKACTKVSESIFCNSISFITEEGKNITYKGTYRIEKN